MYEFTPGESLTISIMVVGYILLTGWLTLKLRSATSTCPTGSPIRPGNCA